MGPWFSNNTTRRKKEKYTLLILFLNRFDFKLSTHAAGKKKKEQKFLRAKTDLKWNRTETAEKGMGLIFHVGHHGILQIFATAAAGGDEELRGSYSARAASARAPQAAAAGSPPTGRHLPAMLQPPSAKTHTQSLLHHDWK
jgi:hypothetical protein